MTRPQRRRALAAILALPGAAAMSLSAGCANPAAIAAPAGAEPLAVPAPRPDDRWRYRLINRYNGETAGNAVVQVIAVGAEIRLSIERDDGTPAVVERHASAWAVIADAGWDDPIEFESPVPIVPAGARTGSWMRTVSRYRSPRIDKVLRWDQVMRIAGWEQVQVPAGRFEALRIQRRIVFEHPDIFRYMPDRDETLWYAPAVGRWVAREWTGSYMPGSPTGRLGRASEDWVRWEMTAYEPAVR